jgi:hypothetical protein
MSQMAATQACPGRRCQCRAAAGREVIGLIDTVEGYDMADVGGRSCSP